MPPVESDSANLQVVESMLKGLAKVRVERGGWFDSEEETVAVESLAFKIGESIRPFLLARAAYPDRFASPPLADNLFRADLLSVFASIKKNGFYPSPYSPIADVSDEYTDFAAFGLELADQVYDYAEQTKSKVLQKQSQVVARRALAFLTNPEHFLSDDKGCRWGGSNLFARERKIKEYYVDTYFTSLAIIALRRVVERPILALSDREKDKIRSIIRNAGKWIVSRSDAGLLTGDEKRSTRKLIYTTWGLRALVETNDIQEESVRKHVAPLITAYIAAVDEKLGRDGVSLGQDYFVVLTPTFEEPLYYEDRSDWGGIFLTLISLRKLPEVDTLLESTSYKQVLDSVYTGLLVLRNPSTKLWYKDKLILSIHSYLTEGFLLYEKQAKDFGATLSITSGMLRKAVKDTLTDESVLTMIQQIVYASLGKSIRQAKQSETIDQGMAGSPTTHNNAVQKDEVAGRIVTRSVGARTRRARIGMKPKSKTRGA